MVHLFFYGSSANVYCNYSYICDSQKQSNFSGNIYKYESKDDLLIVKNETGENIIGVYEGLENLLANVSGSYNIDDKGNVNIIKNGNVVAQYDSSGNLLYKYTYLDGKINKYDKSGKLIYVKDAAGSDFYYDANGNLKSMTKRGPFTIPEANALTKDGPVNTVTITW